uniref:hypothetical protein n=1 Tax=Ningiella ruwaisensis TaxID=2364274 RepID=UPI00109F4144|nr:hypothetical protein [Ningiella ruwaisensis]
MSSTLNSNPQESSSFIYCSETLQGEFALLKEITFFQTKNDCQRSKRSSKEHHYEEDKRSIFHNRKFSERSVKLLAQHIVCRHYANLSYELAHWMWAVVNISIDEDAQSALFNCFYLEENVTSQRALAFLRSRLTKTNNACKLSSASVLLVDDKTDEASRHLSADGKNSKMLKISIHQHVFYLHLSRINLLACFVEWLLGFVHDAFFTWSSELDGRGLNAIQATAKRIQKDVYEYLKMHLQGAKALSKYQKMQSFLQQQSSGVFDDDLILRFWLQHHAQEGFTRFTTVVNDIFQYEISQETAALQSAHHFAQQFNHNDTGNEHRNSLPESEHALKIYSDAVIHELEEGQTGAQSFSSLQTLENERFDIEALTQVPKMLSKQQSARFVLMAEFPRQVSRFPLSYLRFIAFSKLQSAHIQSLRNKQPLDNDSLNARWLETEDYLSVARKCAAQIQVNFQTLLSIFYILRQQIETKNAHQSAPLLLEFVCEHQELLDFLIEKVDFQEQVPTLEDVNNNSKLFELIMNSEPLIVALKQAFAKNNRQGFTPDSILKDVNAYIDSALLLGRLSAVLKRFLHKNRPLLNDSESLQAKFLADGCILVDELSKGITHD